MGLVSNREASLVSGLSSKEKLVAFHSRDLKLLNRRINQLGQVGKAHRPSLH